MTVIAPTGCSLFEFLTVKFEAAETADGGWLEEEQKISSVFNMKVVRGFHLHCIVDTEQKDL